MIRIAILDDHVIFTQGIGMIFQNREDIKLVGVVRNRSECVQLLKDEKVDILLNDIQLAQESGIDICELITSVYTGVKVIMLTMHEERSLVKMSLKKGASGYLMKNCGSAELIEAIKKVHQGEQYLSKDIAPIRPQSATSNPKHRYRVIPKLSTREKEVLALILDEKTTTEISSLLFLSVKTIESHRSNLLLKFDVRNMAGLVKKTLEYDINLS